MNELCASAGTGSYGIDFFEIDCSGSNGKKPEFRCAAKTQFEDSEIRKKY